MSSYDILLSSYENFDEYAEVFDEYGKDFLREILCKYAYFFKFFLVGIVMESGEISIEHKENLKIERN